MRVLFDHNVTRKLKKHLFPHEVVLTKDAGWDDLENGELLGLAQITFDVLLTTDTNIYHQQKVERFNIAVIVLRAYNNKDESFLSLIPEVLNLLETISPGTVHYIYADEKLRESDLRKGKGPSAN